MLKGITVIQFQGLAPSVFCGMYFADQGASVIFVAREESAPVSIQIDRNLMNRGKKCVTLSPKKIKQRQIIVQLIKYSDIIIDPYRPGVLEKLNLGPQFIYKINKRAILLRVSGYGQSGPMSEKPGHDLNYISKSGIVPLINQNNSSKIYQFPTNYLADFVSCSLGITATLSALSIAKITGVGRIVDSSLTDGCRYFTKIIIHSPDFKTQQKQNKKQNNIQTNFITIENQQYCIQANQFNIEKAKELISQMNAKNTDYFSDKQYRISKVKGINSLQKQLKQMPNPFDNNFNTSDKVLPKKGQHLGQILQLLKKWQIQKSKF